MSVLRALVLFARVPAGDFDAGGPTDLAVGVPLESVDVIETAGATNGSDAEVNVQFGRSLAAPGG